MKKAILAFSLVASIASFSPAFAAEGTSGGGSGVDSMFNFGLTGGYNFYDVLLGGPIFGVTGGFKPFNHLEIAPTFLFNPISVTSSGFGVTGSLMRITGDIRYTTQAVAGYYIGLSLGADILSLTGSGSLLGNTLTFGSSEFIYGIVTGHDWSITRNVSAGVNGQFYLGSLVPTFGFNLAVKYWL